MTDETSEAERLGGNSVPVRPILLRSFSYLWKTSNPLSDCKNLRMH